MPPIDVFLPEDQFWVIVIGTIMPLATYFSEQSVANGLRAI